MLKNFMHVILPVSELKLIYVILEPLTDALKAQEYHIQGEVD